MLARAISRQRPRQSPWTLRHEQPASAPCRPSSASSARGPRAPSSRRRRQRPRTSSRHRPSPGSLHTRPRHVTPCCAGLCTHVLQGWRRRCYRQPRRHPPVTHRSAIPAAPPQIAEHSHVTPHVHFPCAPATSNDILRHTYIPTRSAHAHQRRFASFELGCGEPSRSDMHARMHTQERHALTSMHIGSAPTALHRAPRLTTQQASTTMVRDPNICATQAHQAPVRASACITFPARARLREGAGRGRTHATTGGHHLGHRLHLDAHLRERRQQLRDLALRLPGVPREAPPQLGALRDHVRVCALLVRHRLHHGEPVEPQCDVGLCVGTPTLGALLPGWDAVLAVIACCTGKAVGSISNSGTAVGHMDVRWAGACACGHPPLLAGVTVCQQSPLSGRTVCSHDWQQPGSSGHTQPTPETATARLRQGQPVAPVHGRTPPTPHPHGHWPLLLAASRCSCGVLRATCCGQ